jgi:hypothetical protein
METIVIVLDSQEKSDLVEYLKSLPNSANSLWRK